MDLIWLLFYPRPRYSTKMIFSVLDDSLIMGLNIGETDKVFCINFISNSIIEVTRTTYGPAYSPIL